MTQPPDAPPRELCRMCLKEEAAIGSMQCAICQQELVTLLAEMDNEGVLKFYTICLHLRPRDDWEYQTLWNEVERRMDSAIPLEAANQRIKKLEAEMQFKPTHRYNRTGTEVQLLGQDGPSAVLCTEDGAYMVCKKDFLNTPFWFEALPEPEKES